MHRPLHQPKQKLIVDYVLGLLDSAEVKTLERHAATCDTCRHAIQQERQVGLAVRNTLTAYPAASHARLMQLKPAMPKPAAVAAWPQWVHGVQRQLAVALVVMVLFLGVGFQQLQGSWGAVASPMPTTYVMTSTATTEPTATHTQVALVPLQNTVTPAITPVPEMHSR